MLSLLSFLFFSLLPPPIYIYILKYLNILYIVQNFNIKIIVLLNLNLLIPYYSIYFHFFYTLSYFDNILIFYYYFIILSIAIFVRIYLYYFSFILLPFYSYSYYSFSIQSSSNITKKRIIISPFLSCHVCSYLFFLLFL